MSRQLFEAAEASGLDRRELVAAVGGDVWRWSDPANELEWDELAALFSELERLCGGDPERVRAVGRALVHAPHWSFIQQLARSVIPLGRIYQAGADWIAPAQFPHLVLEQRARGPRELHVRVAIPEPYAPSRGLLLFFEGVLEEVPRLLGLPRARLASSHVTARTLDSLVELPRTDTSFTRLKRRARALLWPSDLLDAFEEQRRELTAGLSAMRSETLEVKRLFEDLPDLVLVHRAGVILWKNRTCATVLGYDTADDLVGRSVLDIVAPGSRELVRRRMSVPIGDPMPALEDTLLVARDGREVRVEVAPACEVVFGGAPARLVVARDVTERTRLQRRLAITDRMAAIGMLAAGVAHEVNNPLGYILNNIEIANRELYPLGEAAAGSLEALAIALEGVERIRLIVRQLVQLSRVDEAVVVGPLDLGAVVESTLALLGPDLTANATLVRDFAPVPAVRGGAARLGQVLLNVLVNAAEAMAGRASPGDNELRVTIRPAPGGGATIAVSDTGSGVSPEHRARIFEPFFTTKVHGQSTGLGLTVSQLLIAEVGGDLTYTPRTPRGSTFTITLATAT